MNSEGKTCFLCHLMAGVAQKRLSYLKLGLWLFRLQELEVLRLHHKVIAEHFSKF